MKIRFLISDSFRRFCIWPEEFALLSEKWKGHPDFPALRKAFEQVYEFEVEGCPKGGLFETDMRKNQVE